MNDLVKKAQALADQVKQQQPQPQQPPKPAKKESAPKNASSAGGSGGGRGQGEWKGSPARSDETSASIIRALFTAPVHDLRMEAEQLRRDLQKQHLDDVDLGEVIQGAAGVGTRRL